MDIHLASQAFHPLLPNLVPGVQLTLSLCGNQITVTTPATTLLLHNIVAAMRDGAVIPTCPGVESDDLIRELRAMMAHRMEVRAAG